ncbi:MAG: cytidylate kinase-like family protein [Anaerostipes sp.]|nr:cytidylate kinase-like family protein [Anaerostipes sp.]
MRPNTLICISREYGSGGHEIGKLLSKKLGIPMYDKEIISHVAKEANVSEEFVKEKEGADNYSYIFGIPAGHGYMGNVDKNQIMTPKRLFEVQSRVIQKIAEKEGSCIFVGRCADIILQKYPGCHTFFIHSSSEERVKRLVATEGFTEKQAMKEMKKTDNERASYHNYYTKMKWGHPSNYELIINTGRTGLERGANIIVAYLED